MMRMVGTTVDIIVKIVDEKMIVNMPRYIFFGQKRINKLQNETSFRLQSRPDDDFGVESLSHFVYLFLTKKI